MADDSTVTGSKYKTTFRIFHSLYKLREWFAKCLIAVFNYNLGSNF